jgi:Spy/CpxP family protein refolding chaperone
MRIETKKRLKTLSIAVSFTFALSASPVWADSNSSAHVSGASDSHHISGVGSSDGHHVSGAGSHGKSEGSKGRTWGRGTYKEKHGHSPKHAEGSGKKHSGHYAKGHHSGTGHSASGYGHKGHSVSKHHHAKGHHNSGGHSVSGHGHKGHSGSSHHYAKAHCAVGSSIKGHGHKSSGGDKHGGHSKHKKDPFVHVLKFKCQLKLTEVQVSEIKNQQFEFEKVSIRSHAAHKIAHMELDRVIHAENVDEAKARKLAEIIAETKTRKIKAMVEGKLAVMRILTADQKRIITRMYNRHN